MVMPFGAIITVAKATLDSYHLLKPRPVNKKGSYAKGGRLLGKTSEPIARGAMASDKEQGARIPHFLQVDLFQEGFNPIRERTLLSSAFPLLPFESSALCLPPSAFCYITELFSNAQGS